MDLSVFGWIDGISATFVVVSGFIMATFIFYKWKISKIRMHFYTGLILLFAGLSYSGVFLDFIAVLLTGNNINNVNGEVAILSYIWFPPILTLAIIVFADILIPKKKSYIASVYILISVLFYVSILTDPYGSFNFGYPKNPGEELIDYNVNMFSLAGICIIIYQLSILLIIFLGFLPKSLKAKLIIRRKFFTIIIGMLTIIISGLFESWMILGMVIIIIRACYILGFYIWYLGLQPVKDYLILARKDEATEDSENKDNITFIAEKLGIDIIKPDILTEEEIAFYKEKTLCLVCKKDLSRFTSIFICSECKSLYCQKCAHALTELENVCWACNTPIDENKPIKHIMKKEEDLDIEKSEKLHKNNKK